MFIHCSIPKIGLHIINVKGLREYSSETFCASSPAEMKYTYACIVKEQDSAPDITPSQFADMDVAAEKLLPRPPQRLPTNSTRVGQDGQAPTNDFC